MSDRAADYTTELEKLKTSLKSSAADLSSERDNLEKVVKLRDQLRAELDTSNQKYSELQSVLDAKTQSERNSREEVENLTNQIHTLTQDISVQSENLLSQEKELKSLRQTLAESKLSVDSLEGERKSLRAEHKTLSAELKSYLDRIDAGKAENEKLKVDLQQSSAAVSQLENDVMILKV